MSRLSVTLFSTLAILVQKPASQSTREHSTKMLILTIIGLISAIAILPNGIHGLNSTNLNRNHSAINNGTNSSYARMSKNSLVDCFGIGQHVATLLEWNLKSNTNPLDVYFYMSSTHRPRRVNVYLGDQFGLEWTNFVITRRTIVIVHGFLSRGDETWIRKMEEAFHTWGDVNVIIVDWSANGNTWNYYRAAVHAQIVGQQISRLLSHIVNATREEVPDETTWGSIHMIGHSLGAHICGIAADYFKNVTTTWKIDRITGLDPAQPCFRNSHLSLDVSDAPFVDVIHTNGALLSQIGLGMPEPIGHVDFYPNGGRYQPACSRQSSTYRSYLAFWNMLDVPQQAVQKAICSHGFSYVYFTDSINSRAAGNCTFYGCSWNRTYRHALQIINNTYDARMCAEMGLGASSTSLRGTFFVMTSAGTPYCDVGEDDKIIIEKQLMEDFKSDYLD